MEKILIVEDETNVRENIVELLTCENYDCIEAHDGLDAIKKIKNNLPDLIISDIKMPNINGFELYNLVRSLETEKIIPFIFLSAKADDESVNYAFRLGADDFLVKPYKAETILQRINTRLNKQKQINDRFDKLKTNISLYVPHELRTPLIAILGYSELLSQEFSSFTDTEKMDMINSIHSSGLRFQNRVEKLINYTELKLSNSLINFIESFSTENFDYIKKLKTSFECTCRINDVSCFLENANVKISSHDFEILFKELLENACKHSPKGSEIKVVGRIKNDNYELLTSNDGYAITIKDFNEFTFLNDNYNQEGNGLGLSIIQMIVKKYDLDIKIESSSKVNIIINLKLSSDILN